MRATLFTAMFLVAVAGVATAQSASCLDAAEESHHQLLISKPGRPSVSAGTSALGGDSIALSQPAVP